MRILVTGGTGLLGGRLLPALVAAGHQVFALVRSASSRERVRELGAQPVDGDLESSAPRGLPALDAVVHAAAMFRISGPRAPFFQVNVMAPPDCWRRLSKLAWQVSFISTTGLAR